MRYKFIFFCCFVTAVPIASPLFEAWIEETKIRALKQGVTEEVWAKSFYAIKAPLKAQPAREVVRQPFLSLHGAGVDMFRKNQLILSKICKRYDVDAPILLALWGIESKYGQEMGTSNTIHALATHAFNGKNRKFYTQELFNALKIVQHKNIDPCDLKGSPYGTMGGCQFLPSSFLDHTVDQDRDGKADIWNSTPDLLASMANYLHKMGWQKGKGWGRPVVVPKKFPFKKYEGLKKGHPLSFWKKLGINSSSPWPEDSMNAYLVRINDRPFLVYDNFKSLLKWNYSKGFVLKVCKLADQIQVAS